MNLKKAPSGRELAPQATEGEGVAMENVQIQSHAGSFRHAIACHLPPGGRLFYFPHYIHRGQRTKSILCPPVGRFAYFTKFQKLSLRVRLIAGGSF